MQVTIGNIITSLRLLSSMDWADVFESMSDVETLLRQDSVYPRMDFASRNIYRSAIEELAKGSDCTEQEIARLAIELARNESSTTLRSHVGYWLIDAGRGELESRIEFRPKLSQRLIHLGLRHPYATYFGGWIALGVALWLAALTWWLAVDGMSGSYGYGLPPARFRSARCPSPSGMQY